MRVKRENWESGDSVYVTDSFGEQLALIDFDKDQKLQSLCIYESDELGRDIGWVSLNQFGKPEKFFEQTYKADSYEPTCIIEYDGEHNFLRKTELVLDEEERVIKELHFNKENQKVSEGVYIYIDEEFSHMKYVDNEGNEIPEALY
ncbi:hypothetical protein [Zooshikella harenae]|uniref:Uncharacterized protein n=1 Tax=Zooshikella harenae TaxID=2827238 RepID=A0ABS5ZK74_9GAMM|nr:hypothetical protein [Zooshikella harenae]MBU2714476.1 hypothetical protein [Zooshikella harenae]